MPRERIVIEYWLSKAAGAMESADMERLRTDPLPKSARIAKISTLYAA